MRSIRIGLTAALSALLLSATSAPASEEKSSVVVSAPWEITSVDPATSGYVFLRMQIYETLVDVDADGGLIPGLASDWEVSADALTWTFEMRDGVDFHDGTPLTAEAAASALQRAKDQPGVIGKAPIAEISAEEGAVKFVLSQPFAALPAFLANYTALIAAPASFDADGKPIAAIGTGPFKIAEINPPQGLFVTRFEDYWGDAPAIESARYLAAGRAETRALLAESGDADMVFTLDPSGYARLESVDAIETIAVPIPRVVTLKANAGHPFLSDAKARQALSMAIDREGIAIGITRFPESVASQLFPPVLGAWHDASLAPLAHDPEAARALLAELGWKPGEDGILERDGERFSILLRTFSDRPELPLIATALQDQFRAVGIDLEVSVANYSEIPAGHQDGSLHVALYARNYGLTPDPIGNALADFGTGGGDWGAMNWEVPEVAEALETIAANADEDVRRPLIAKVAATLQDELPLIPIVWYQHTVAVAKGLDGVVVDPLERTYGLSKVSWTK